MAPRSLQPIDVGDSARPEQASQQKSECTILVQVLSCRIPMPRDRRQPMRFVSLPMVVQFLHIRSCMWTSFELLASNFAYLGVSLFPSAIAIYELGMPWVPGQVSVCILLELVLWLRLLSTSELMRTLLSLFSEKEAWRRQICYHRRDVWRCAEDGPRHLESSNRKHTRFTLAQPCSNDAFLFTLGPLFVAVCWRPTFGANNHLVLLTLGTHCAAVGCCNETSVGFESQTIWAAS
jgi:hypothetical protein